MERSIADLVQNIKNNFVNRVTTHIPEVILIKARQNSKRPLSVLQYIVLSIIRADCGSQDYCDRSIQEFANLSGHSVDGVKKALCALNKGLYIFTKKRSRGYNSVRVISRVGLTYKLENNKAPQKAPQKSNSQAPILNKISYSFSDQDKTDLLARDSIIKTSKREEEVFKILEFNEFDELVVTTALKRSGLSVEARFRLATIIMQAHYKRSIEYKRAYYLTSIENQRELQ